MMMEIGKYCQYTTEVQIQVVVVNSVNIVSLVYERCRQFESMVGKQI